MSDTKDTAMAAAFAAAKPLKHGQPPTAAGKEQKAFLSAEEVAQLEVPSISDEEMKKAAEEAAERRKAARALGEKLAEINAALEKIYAIPGWEDTPSLQKAEEIYRKHLETLSSQGDEAFREQVRIAIIFSRIHQDAATEKNIREIIADIRAAGRGHACQADSFRKKEGGKRDYPAHSVVFKDVVLVIPNDHLTDGRASKTDHGLYTALRGMVERYYRDYRQAQESMMGDIMGQEVKDLNVLLNREVPLAEKVGSYRIHFPERREEGGRRHDAGAAILEVYFRGAGEKPFLAVEVKKASGSLSGFGKDTAGFWLPMNMLFMRALPESYSGERLDKAERMRKVFRAATFEVRRAYHEEHKSE